MLRSFGVFLILVFLGIPSSVAAGNRADLRLIFGVAGPGLGDLNDYYVDGFAVPTGLTDGSFDHGLKLGFDFSYPVFSGRLRVGFSGILTGIDDREQVDIEFISQSTATYIADSDFDVKALVLMARYEQTFQVFSRTAWIGGGPLYGFGRVDLKSNWLDTDGFVEPMDESAEYKADGFGLNFATGADLVSVGPIFSAVEAGYDWLNLGNLRDDAGAYWRFDASNPGRALGLDLSGPYFVVAAGFKF